MSHADGYFILVLAPRKSSMPWVKRIWSSLWKHKRTRYLSIANKAPPTGNDEVRSVVVFIEPSVQFLFINQVLATEEMDLRKSKDIKSSFQRP